jgi:hypothetical protein
MLYHHSSTWRTLWYHDSDRRFLMLGWCLLWLWLLVVVPPWLADVAARGLVTSWLPYHQLSLISAGIFSGSVLLFAGSARSRRCRLARLGCPPPPLVLLYCCVCVCSQLRPHLSVFVVVPTSIRVVLSLGCVSVVVLSFVSLRFRSSPKVAHMWLSSF